MASFWGKIVGGLIGIQFGLGGLIIGVLAGHILDSWTKESRSRGPFLKWAPAIGAILGFLLLSPLGLLPGFFLGIVFQRYLMDRRGSSTPDYGLGPDIDEEGLAWGLFRLFGAFAAASGPTEAQVLFLRQVLARISTFDPADRASAEAAFHTAQQDRPRPSVVAEQLAAEFILDRATLRWVWEVCRQLLHLGHPTEELWRELELTAEHFGFTVRRRTGSARSSRRFEEYWTPPRPQPQEDPYLTLGLSPGASVQDIKAAFRRLARENHPDALSHLAADDPERKRRQERFIRIQQAYETLRAQLGF